MPSVSNSNCRSGAKRTDGKINSDSSRALADLEEVKRRSEARASRGPPNRARSAAIGTKVRLKVGTGLHAKYWRHGNSTCGRTPGC